MRRTAMKIISATTLLICACGLPAKADLCALKHGSYTLSSKYSLKELPEKGINGSFVTGGLEQARPCGIADAADGNADGVVHLNFHKNENIIIDVVYEQDATTQYKVDYFENVMFYAGANDGNKMSVVSCNDDPANFFLNDAFRSDVCAEGLNNDGEPNLVVTSEGLNLTGNSWPQEPANFVLDRITFTNSLHAGTDVYTIDFQRDNAQHSIVAVQDVGVVSNNGETCGILSGLPNCGLVIQNILTSKITITEDPCYIGPPPSASVKCAGNPDQCSIDPAGASATVTLNYETPATCYLTSACDTPATTGSCADVSANTTAVIFNNLGGVEQQEYDGEFQETIPIDPEAPAPAYQLAGAARPGSGVSCLPSSSCAAPRYTVATAPKKCECEDPPKISGLSPANDSFVPSTSVAASFSTDKEAHCRWSRADDGYDSMSENCGDITYTTSHVCNIEGLTDQQSNEAHIACIDNPGSKDSSATNTDLNYTVDSSPPSDISFIYDGLSADLDTAELVESISANWGESTDSMDAQPAYLLAVGTSKGGSDISGWVEITDGLSKTITSPDFTDGITYYASVKAKNKAGLFSSIATSDGLYFYTLTNDGISLDDGGEDIQEWKSVGSCRENMTFNAEDIFATSVVEIVAFENGNFEHISAKGNISLEHGKGYYVLAIKPGGAKVAESGSPFSGDSYTFTLKNNWNFIANPFCQPLLWNENTAQMTCGGVIQNKEKLRLYIYDGKKYVPINADGEHMTMPWKAYWIKSPEEGCLLKINKN